jgi:ATP-binding cassette, subfamily B, multidrug efflux pump
MKHFGRLLGFLKPYLFIALLGPAFMMVEVIMDLAQPRIIQNIVDIGLKNRDLAYVLRMGALMVGVAVVGLVGGVGCTYFSTKAAINMGTDLRGTVFRKIQSLSYRNLDGLETGNLITRMTNDIVQIQQVTMMMLRILVRAPLLVIGSIIMALMTSLKLSLILLVIVPLLLIAIWIILKRAFPLFSRVQSRLDRVNTVMQENLAGVRLVKAFVRAVHEKKRFCNANEDLMSTMIRASRTTARIMPIMVVLLNGGIAVALWIGGVEAIEGDLQLGQIIAFINYLMQLLRSLMMVSMLLVRFSRGEASAQRITEVLDMTSDLTDPETPQDVPVPTGEVCFDDVSFYYNGSADEAPALEHISFMAKPGEVVAILGSTGSGKTTLINLIPRLYDVSSGSITIDGVDIRDMDKKKLRGMIGVVPQQPILFSGSVHDNVVFGKIDATKNEIDQSVAIAQAREFVEQLPDGYSSMLGQRGVNLSGGQKQRLSIARAVLPNPPVLILDDSSSAVDMKTAADLQKALRTARNDRTTIVVAQRIQSVLDADEILVLENGRVAGQGKHDELLTTCDLYKDIYDSQMKDSGNE